MELLELTEAAIEAAVRVLRAGGIIAHPTETCYGLACDITNPEAVARLFELKRRPPQSPVSALFPSLDEAKKYVEWTDAAEPYARRLPGPLTLILPLKIDASMPLFATPSGTKNIGVRVSSNPFAQKLVTAFGKPLSTTSANLHGQPPAYSPGDLLVQFDEEDDLDLILDGGQLPRNPPSTIVDLTGASVTERARVQ